MYLAQVPSPESLKTNPKLPQFTKTNTRMVIYYYLLGPTIEEAVGGGFHAAVVMQGAPQSTSYLKLGFVLAIAEMWGDPTTIALDSMNNRT